MVAPDRRLGGPEVWVSCGREDAQISRFWTRSMQCGSPDSPNEAEAEGLAKPWLASAWTCCAGPWRFTALRPDLEHDLAAGVPACDPCQRLARLFQRQDRLDLRAQLAGVD